MAHSTHTYRNPGAWSGFDGTVETWPDTLTEIKTRCQNIYGVDAKTQTKINELLEWGYDRRDNVPNSHKVANQKLYNTIHTCTTPYIKTFVPESMFGKGLMALWRLKKTFESAPSEAIKLFRKKFRNFKQMPGEFFQEYLARAQVLRSNLNHYITLYNETPAAQNKPEQPVTESAMISQALEGLNDTYNGFQNMYENMVPDDQARTFLIYKNVWPNGNH